MNAEFLEASLAGERAAAERRVDVRLPDAWPLDPAVLAMRLEQLQADPDLAPWLTRLMCLAEEPAIGAWA